MYFLGVTTNQSSILRVFPAWSEALGLDARIIGMDFPLGEEPENYRHAVSFIKGDPLSLGGLVTTHKLNILKAASDLFDELDPYAETLGEISCISKRGDQLRGHAKDPITSGLSLEAIVTAEYWRETGGHLLLLGAGGSSLALTLYLHNKAAEGQAAPSKIIVTARGDPRLDEMREIHRAIGFSIPIDYRRIDSELVTDAVVASLPSHSMVVNATGLGKDRPGSPITEAAVFPESGIAWEFNYRGNLLFLDQARRAAPSRDLRVEDGWTYFIHGWTRVIAEVFDIDIPTRGPAFDRLLEIAKRESSRN